MKTSNKVFLCTLASCTVGLVLSIVLSRAQAPPAPSAQAKMFRPGAYYAGITAAGIPLPATCGDGWLWLVTGKGFTGSNPRQGLYLCMNNSWSRIAGSGGGGNVLGGQGSEYFFQGNNWFFTAQNSINPSIFFRPAIGMIDAVMTFTLVSSNPLSSADGNQSFSIETNSSNTKNTTIEVYGQGKNLGPDYLNIGEYTQRNNPANPNLRGIRLCFGNVGSPGWHCPDILDKNGNRIRTTSTGIPPPVVGSVVDYIDPTSRAPRWKNEAGTVFSTPVIGTPSSATDPCSPGQSEFDDTFAYYCVVPNSWKRTPIYAW